MNRTTKIISEAYLDFVRSQRCVVVHIHAGPIDPHHLVAQGWRQGKRNDLTAVSLCRLAHSEIEQIGVEKFEYKYGLSIWQENAWQLIEFFSDGDRRKSVDVTFGKDANKWSPLAKN